MFFELLYDKVAQEALQDGNISTANILIGYGSNYLWMFCPIIVGIPCVLIGKTERFVMFRTSKNKYMFCKFLANMIASGMILVIAYGVFSICCTVVTGEVLWNVYFAKKLASVFCWGIYCAIPSTIISEFVENKYLILCIPFVINYFMCMFLSNIVPYQVEKYVSPWNYQILFLYKVDEAFWYLVILLVLIMLCVVMKKVLMERRCDCGQK